MTIVLLLGLGLWLCWLPSRSARSSPARRVRPRTRRTGSREKQLQQELECDARCLLELAALLRSGVPFAQAVEVLVKMRREPGPVARAFEALNAASRLEHGGMQSLAGFEASSVRRLGWCLHLSARSGAPLAQVLEQLARDLEADLAAHQSFEAAMAGPRATTRLLTWLPVAGLSAGFLLGIDVPHALLTSAAAQASVAGGLVLWGVNRIWCQRLLAAAMAQGLR